MHKHEAAKAILRERIAVLQKQQDQIKEIAQNAKEAGFFGASVTDMIWAGREYCLQQIDLQLSLAVLEIGHPSIRSDEEVEAVRGRTHPKAEEYKDMPLCCTDGSGRYCYADPDGTLRLKIPAGNAAYFGAGVAIPVMFCPYCGMRGTSP